MIKITCWIVLLGCGFLGYTQNIKGRVVDGIDNTALVGALILDVKSGNSAVTNENGAYSLEDLEPGYSEIAVSYLGYWSQAQKEVLITSGKTVRLDFNLERNPTALEEVVIRSANPMISPGKRTINEEQLNRFASTYYDPARLMTTSPDVAISNDQNNQISIRGISPAYNKWRLEGVEIVNPNHLANAGTITDQPAGTSGGVNILSAQMLGSSSLNFGVFNNKLNNSIGGIFDMNFKSGTTDDLQFTAQASLIGFDFSAEGPISSGSKSSFIANYRYSFTGLLTSMGVDFGGESIGFQDISFAVDTPIKNGNVKVFGVGGLNFNHFDHLSFADSEREKDRKDIYADGKMGVAGISIDKSSFNATIVYSGLLNERDESIYNSMDQIDSMMNTRRDESILASSLTYSIPSANGIYQIGLVNNLYQYGSVSQALSQVSMTSTSFRNKITAEWGVTVSTNGFDSFVFEPRINVSYVIANDWSIYGGVGRFSQLLDPGTYLFAVGESDSEYSLFDEYDFIESIRTVIGLQGSMGLGELQTELFYYTFSDLNSTSLGKTAFTRGLSSTYSKAFDRNWHILVGGSLFDSKIEVDVNNPFNTQYSFNLATGKDFTKIKKGTPRNFSVNVRGILQGGKFYGYPYDAPFGDFRISPDFAIVAPFSSQLPSYFRTDLRLQWTKSKENSTRIVSLDVQNLLMTENIGFYYYDSFLGEEMESLQLGLIPILTYRYEF